MTRSPGGSADRLQPSSSGASVGAIALHSSSQIGKLARLHHPVSGLPDQEITDGAQVMRSYRVVAADHDAGLCIRQFGEFEGPERVAKPARTPRGGIEGAPAQVERRAQREEVRPIACCDLKPRAPGWR